MSSSQATWMDVEEVYKWKPWDMVLLESERPGFQFCLPLSSSVGFGFLAHVLTTLNLSFFICKMEVMTSSEKFLKINEIMFVMVTIITL